MPGAAGPPPPPGLPVFPPPPVCRSLPASNVRAPVAPPAEGLHACRWAHVCCRAHAWHRGALACHPARPRAPGCPPASLPASARGRQPGTRGRSAGWDPHAGAGPAVVTPGQGPSGNRHASGCVGRRVGGAPGSGQAVLRFLPCVGLCSVPAWKGCGKPPCHGRAAGANGTPGTVGVQRGHTWAPGVCRRGHVRRTGGSRIRGGAGELLPFPGAPANPRVRGGSGATCARACAHAGHLLKHGEIFFFPATPAGAEGACAPAPARSVPGARGSAACEQPFAFLGHVAAACAGWRLGSRGHR